MAWKKYDLTLTICVDIDAGPEADAIQPDGICKSLLDDRWCDGRYPFADEMLSEGLQRMIRRAVADCLAPKYEAIHGNATEVSEYEEHGLKIRSEMSLAHKTATEAYGRVAAFVQDKIVQCQMVERS